MNKKITNRILQVMLVFMLAFTACPQVSAKAASVQSATLRIISTTDLHGQVSTMHYDFGSQKYGSLAQAYTLIRQARTEVGMENTLTLDVGDSVFGYAADYIVNHSDSNVVQPIYQAMAAINYDAITLGNHDFDYGFPYIKKQLELSGLDEKCIVSNVVINDTGEMPWNESKMVEKQLTTANGKTVDVKIGIVGVTVPSLSGYSNCQEELTGLPIVSSVDRAASKLKAEGADVVVVMAHSSFGKAKPKDDAKNAVYALAMLDSVDAIAAGHAHKNFPSDDEKSASFYDLKKVDKQTGLVNGKPVVMTADHGAGIGLMDIGLEVSADGKVHIADAATSLWMVDKDTVQNQDIVDTQKEAIEPVEASLKQVIGSLSANERIDSYFALLEDNYAIQLVNESKIQYGLNYTGGNGKARYDGYPVVAMTNYKLCSSQSSRDQISLNGLITMQDILNMQQANHNNNIIYWIDGSQLKELLEWSASIYSTSDGNITSDEVLEQLLEKRGAKSIAAAEWLEDWGAFAVFDGVEYTIDATQNSRYTKLGTLKDASASRIISLTHNGEPVTPDHKFMLVCDDIADNDATKGIADQKVLGRIGVDMAYKNLTEYVRQQQEFGGLTPSVDHNWNVVFDYGSEYIVRASIFSQPDAVVQSWFQELAATNEAFAYYLAQFVKTEAEDKDAPLLVAASTQTEETNSPVEIKVQANDRSGVAQVRCIPGKVEPDSISWADAMVITSGAFTVEANGVYSVAAQDIYGNQAVRYISVSNINPQSLPAPTIKKITNKSDVVTGKAALGTTVHINAGGQTYEAKAEKKGSYSCDVDFLAAGSEVTAYCTDDTGKASRLVSTIVVKDGPDVPVLKTITNKSTQVSGKYTMNAPFTLVMFEGSTAYISSEQGRSLYENSPAYEDDFAVEVLDYEQDGESFHFPIPLYDAGTELEFVTIDKIGRISGTVEVTTADAAPDQPRLEEVCDAELTIRGHVTSVCDDGTVQVTVGGKKFHGEVAPDGTFAVQTNGLQKGQTVSVVAKDEKDGEIRKSVKAELKVRSYKNYTDMGLLEIEPVYDNSKQVEGVVEPGYTAYIRIQGKEEQLAVDVDGAFVYPLEQALSKGEKIYLTARSQDGIEDTMMQKVLKAKKPKKPKKSQKDKKAKADQKKADQAKKDKKAKSVGIENTEAKIAGYQSPAGQAEELKTEKDKAADGKDTEEKTAETLRQPETPSVLNQEITNSTQQLKVLAKGTGFVRIEVDGKVYTLRDGEYNQAYDGYIYTFDLPQAEGAQQISISQVSEEGVESNTITVMRTWNENEKALQKGCIQAES